MASDKRPRVLHTDGKLINLVHHRGHLLVCSQGCCYRLAQRGFAPIIEDLYHNEWEQRKLRNRVHLTQSGRLGPCTLADVMLHPRAGKLQNPYFPASLESAVSR